MRIKLLLGIGIGIFFGALAAMAWMPGASTAHAQPGTPGGQALRTEYKVILAPTGFLKAVVNSNGQPKEIIHGTSDPAGAMTKQFNTLADAGWEYVGPIAPKGRFVFLTGATEIPPDSVDGVLILFKKSVAR